MIQQNMKFEKVFENAIDPGAVAELLESFLTRFELIQLVPPAWAELAYYEENTRDFLFPEPKLRPSHPGIHREILMKTAIGFPGIAPKLEFSTRTAIRECVFPHRTRFLDEEYKPQKPSSNIYGQIPPLKNKKKKSKNRHDRRCKDMQSRAPSPYFTRRFFLDQPTQLDLGHHFRSTEDRKPPFVVRHVDSAKPFGEDNLEHHLLKSQRKSNFSDFLFPMRRGSLPVLSPRGRRSMKEYAVFSHRKEPSSIQRKSLSLKEIMSLKHPAIFWRNTQYMNRDIFNCCLIARSSM